ncbi:nitroreductase family protein [Flavobacterium tegetincola]|uniref:nitroreductase family protein n=1 Tax=Flavobacterium tegetincola TaxID=150172 RepID=UPI00316AD436
MPKKVCKEDLNKIFEAARLALTSSGLQQYRLLVVSNQEIKETILKPTGTKNFEHAARQSYIGFILALGHATELKIAIIPA